MGISKKELINISNKILTGSLSDLGYQFSAKGFSSNGFFYYKNDIEKNIYYIIEMQLSGFNNSDIFDIYVNIARSGNINSRIPDNIESFVEKYILRLGDWIYLDRKKVKTAQWKWHFQTAEEAETIFNEIFPLLQTYAIPFLENPSSSKKDYIRTLRNRTK